LSAPSDPLAAIGWGGVPTSKGEEREKGMKGMGRGKGQREGEGGKGRGGTEGEGKEGSPCMRSHK